jgi:hypothetical protein
MSERKIARYVQGDIKDLHVNRIGNRTSIR